MPCSLGVSERAPAPTHRPSATLSRCGMWWETTRMPFFSVESSTPINS